MGNRDNKKKKPARAGWHNPNKIYRSKAEKMRQKRWVSKNNESGDQNISDNDTIGGDNRDENMSDNDTVNYNDNVNMSDNGDVALNMSDMDTIGGDDMDVNISDNDTVNSNFDVNMRDSENVDVNMSDNDNANVNMSDISDIETENVSGEDNDNANDSLQGYLVITDEGPRSSTSCRPRKSTKGPSRKLPYEPRRPIRTGWLDCMHKSKRSSARLTRNSVDQPLLLQSVDFKPGSGTSTSAVEQQQEARASESADSSEVTRSSGNSRHPLRDDMIRISQENASYVSNARTRSAEPPRAENNQNINYEELDSKLVNKPKPTAGKSP